MNDLHPARRSPSATTVASIGRLALVGSLVAGAWLLASPTRVFAETALLLPPSGDPALKDRQIEAQRVLENALRAQAIRIVNQTDAAAQLGGSAKECKVIDCAQPLLEASGADIAAALAVWGSAADKPSIVYVTLVDRHGDRYPAKTRVEQDDLPGTVKEALLEARALQMLGPGPWLHVNVAPASADVEIDGKTVGSAPLRIPIQPGRHTLEVRMEGYRPHAQTVDIPPSDARQIDVDIQLIARNDPDENAASATAEAAAAVDTDSDSGRTSERKRAIVGPLVLGGAGAALVIYDVTVHLIAIAQGSCQRREIDGACTKKHEVNLAPTIAYGAVGGAAIAAAVLWYVLDDGTEAEPRGSRVRVSAGLGTLSVAGRF